MGIVIELLIRGVVGLLFLMAEIVLDFIVNVIVMEALAARIAALRLRWRQARRTA